jgi:hypothetical protein
MSQPDAAYWMSTPRRALEDMVTRLVGFPVEVYWLSGAALGLGPGPFYQIMPTVEAEQERQVFWGWHLDNNPQFFSTPLEAATAFVLMWRQWVRERS